MESQRVGGGEDREAFKRHAASPSCSQGVKQTGAAHAVLGPRELFG